MSWLPSEEAGAHGPLPRRDLTYIALEKSGYIESIHEEEALKFAREYGVHLRLLCRPGHYMLKGIPVAAHEPLPLPVSRNGGSEEEQSEGDANRRAVQSLFSVGERRTRRQHVEFEIHALVEIALRALSPGINDPFTALTCIDRLTDGLSRILQHGGGTRTLFDSDGERRVTCYPTSFEHYLDSAYFPIRQAAAGNAMVALKLLSSMRGLAYHASSRRHLTSIAEHGDMILEAFKSVVGVDHDVAQVEERNALVRQTCVFLRESAKFDRLPANDPAKTVTDNL